MLFFHLHAECGARILEDVHDVNSEILVSSDDVFFNIEFEFATILAIRTLEARHNTALISEMPRQIPLPLENAITIIIRATKFASIVVGERFIEDFKRSINVWKQKNKRGIPN